MHQTGSKWIFYSKDFCCWMVEWFIDFLVRNMRTLSIMCYTTGVVGAVDAGNSSYNWWVGQFFLCTVSVSEIFELQSLSCLALFDAYCNICRISTKSITLVCLRFSWTAERCLFNVCMMATNTQLLKHRKWEMIRKLRCTILGDGITNRCYSTT